MSWLRDILDALTGRKRTAADAGGNHARAFRLAAEAQRRGEDRFAAFAEEAGRVAGEPVGIPAPGEVQRGR